MDVPADRCLALVAAHPDDDAFGCSGSVALHGDEPGFRYVLIHATDGKLETLPRGSPPPATRETLGAIRRSECENAWRAHGREPDRHEWFGYPDGGLAAVPQHELVSRIAQVLEQERPRVVLTFGPDGTTGHPNHIAVGRATDAAFHRCAPTGVRDWTVCYTVPCAAQHLPAGRVRGSERAWPHGIRC